MGSGSKSNVAQPSKVKVHKKVSFDTKSYRYNFARKSTFARTKTRRQIGRMKCMVLNIAKVNVAGYEIPSNPALEPASSSVSCARLLPVYDVLARCSRTTPVKEKYLKSSARVNGSDSTFSSTPASGFDDCSTEHLVSSNSVNELEELIDVNGGGTQTSLKGKSKDKAKKRKARPILLVQEYSKKKKSQTSKLVFGSSKMKSHKKKRRHHSREGVSNIVPPSFQSTAKSPEDIELIENITSIPVREKKRLEVKSPHEGSNSGQSCSLEVKTIGVSLSKGVQVDESFVVDREVIDSYVFVKVNEALYEMKERLHSVEKQFSKVTKEKERMEMILNEKVQLIRELTMPGFKPSCVDKAVGTDNVSVSPVPTDLPTAKPLKKSRSKTRHQNAETQTEVGDLQCLKPLMGTSLAPYLQLRSNTPVISSESESEEPENAEKVEWMFHNSEVSARCHAIRPQVRLLRALKTKMDPSQFNLEKYKDILPDEIGWDALGPDLQNIFVKIFELSRFFEELPMTSTLKSRCESVVKSLSHVLSHLPFPDSITQTINVKQLNQPKVKDVVSYLFGWKLKEVIKLLRAAYSSKCADILPQYLKAELCEADRILYKTLKFAVHGMRNSAIPHQLTNDNAFIKSCAGSQPDWYSIGDDEDSGESCNSDDEIPESLPGKHTAPAGNKRDGRVSSQKLTKSREMTLQANTTKLGDTASQWRRQGTSTVTTSQLRPPGSSTSTGTAFQMRPPGSSTSTGTTSQLRPSGSSTSTGTTSQLRPPGSSTSTGTTFQLRPPGSSNSTGATFQMRLQGSTGITSQMRPQVNTTNSSTASQMWSQSNRAQCSIGTPLHRASNPGFTTFRMWPPSNSVNFNTAKSASMTSQIPPQGYGARCSTGLPAFQAGAISKKLPQGICGTASTQAISTHCRTKSQTSVEATSQIPTSANDCSTMKPQSPVPIAKCLQNLSVSQLVSMSQIVQSHLHSKVGEPPCATSSPLTSMPLMFRIISSSANTQSKVVCSSIPVTKSKTGLPSIDQPGLMATGGQGAPGHVVKVQTQKYSGVNEVTSSLDNVQTTAKFQTDVVVQKKPESTPVSHHTVIELKSTNGPTSYAAPTCQQADVPNSSQLSATSASSTKPVVSISSTRPATSEPAAQPATSEPVVPISSAQPAASKSVVSSTWPATSEPVVSMSSTQPATFEPVVSISSTWPVTSEPVISISSVQPVTSSLTQAATSEPVVSITQAATSEHVVSITQAATSKHVLSITQSATSEPITQPATSEPVVSITQTATSEPVVSITQPAISKPVPATSKLVVSTSDTTSKPVVSISSTQAATSKPVVSISSVQPDTSEPVVSNSSNNNNAVSQSITLKNLAVVPTLIAKSQECSSNDLQAQQSTFQPDNSQWHTDHSSHSLERNVTVSQQPSNLLGHKAGSVLSTEPGSVSQPCTSMQVRTYGNLQGDASISPALKNLLNLEQHPFNSVTQQSPPLLLVEQARPYSSMITTDVQAQVAKQQLSNETILSYLVQSKPAILSVMRNNNSLSIQWTFPNEIRLFVAKYLIYYTKRHPETQLIEPWKLIGSVPSLNLPITITLLNSSGCGRCIFVVQALFSNGFWSKISMPVACSQ